MDFLGNDYVIVSPKRFRESRLLDICYPGILMVLKRRTETQLHFSTLQRLEMDSSDSCLFLKSLQQMNVIDIKQILSAKMVSVNPTIIVMSLSKEELDKMAQRKLLQLPSPLPHISSGKQSYSHNKLSIISK